MEGSTYCYDQDLVKAVTAIKQACSDKDLELPTYSLQHLRNLLRSAPAGYGLGVDLWLLRLWATLPDEALKTLLAIVCSIQ